MDSSTNVLGRTISLKDTSLRNNPPTSPRHLFLRTTFLKSLHELLPATLWYDSGMQQKVFRKTCSDEPFYFGVDFIGWLFLLAEKAWCPSNFRPQFWGRKWLRQFYGRLAFFGSFCWKTPVPIKILLLGGGGFGFLRRGEWKCQFHFYGREDFSDPLEWRLRCSRSSFWVSELLLLASPSDWCAHGVLPPAKYNQELGQEGWAYSVPRNSNRRKYRCDFKLQV